jgi:hypothetical protein
MPWLYYWQNAETFSYFCGVHCKKCDHSNYFSETGQKKRNKSLSDSFAK